jgi:hypothetical protein
MMKKLPAKALPQASVAERPSALPPVQQESAMLQNLAAEIIHCYERARLARERAEHAINDGFKTDFLAAESRWLALALSYDRQHQLSRTVAEFDHRGKAGPSTLMLRDQGLAFDPDDVARLNLDIAYHAVLHQLGLSAVEDGATRREANVILSV